MFLIQIGNDIFLILMHANMTWYGKNFHINAFFTDWFVSKKRDGAAIGNYEDYQKFTCKQKISDAVNTN